MLCVAVVHGMRLVRTKGPNDHWGSWRRLRRAGALRIAGGGTLALHVITTHRPLTRCWPPWAGASLALLHALRLNYHWNRWRGLWDADALRIEIAGEGILAHAALATRGHLQTWASTYSAFLLALLLLPLLL